MCNTGMRPPEAKNLRWRDVAIRADDQGRKFVVLHVRGKDKFRHLVAAGNVADYLERIRAIGKATEPDDFVFTTSTGKPASTLYGSLIKKLLTESGLLRSSSGSQRSTYCFRHTYATFRLTEGVDVYFLSKQMGTSVQMIEDHYGHINPVKNAERILQGLPGWEPITATPQVAAETGRVNADAAKTKAAKPKAKRPHDSLSEPEGRILRVEIDAPDRRAPPLPMRRWRSGLGAEDVKWIYVCQRCFLTHKARNQPLSPSQAQISVKKPHSTFPNQVVRAPHEIYREAASAMATFFPETELISREEYQILMRELKEQRREVGDMNERITDWIGTLMKSELLRRELEEGKTPEGKSIH